MTVSSTPAVTDLGAFAALKASARANDPEAVRKAAQQFEALFTQQLLKSARAANLGDDVLGGGQQMDFYQDMFDQQMALHLSSGKGMGLADVLVKQMIGSGAAPSSGSTIAPSSYPPVTSLAREIVPAQRPKASVAATGTSSDPAGPAAFIDQIRPHATRAAQQLGVPAEAIMAQAALETGWGRHVPSHADGTPSYNYFGIKADSSWDGARLEKATHEHLGGRMQKVTAAFRSYESVGDAFDDYAKFLQSNPRYADALRDGTGGDAGGFAKGLQDAGYATDPAYANKLLKLIGNSTISRAEPATKDAAA
jgi:flagellar protein FlgJ